MNFLKNMAIALMVAVVSFGAMAAKEITKEEAKDKNYQKIGEVTSTDKTSPMDAKKDLSEQADKMNGEYYVIIALNEKGKVNAVAEVYK